MARARSIVIGDGTADGKKKRRPEAAFSLAQ